MKTCGIYKIVNIANNKMYIGQSKNCDKRMKNHINKLKNKSHHNSYLQNSWNKYGETNFEIELIEECQEEFLTKRENHWMYVYNSFDREFGYNVLSPNENKDSYIFPKEVKEKMSKSMTVYTDEELIEFLKKFYEEEKRVPNQRDLKSNKNYPNYGTYYSRFGSFKEALILSGLYESIENKHNFDRVKIKDCKRSDILREVKKIIEENNKPISTKEINENKNIPSSSSIFKMFGTLEELMKECGYSKQYFVNLENYEAIEGLKMTYLRDKWISKNTIDEQILTRSASFYTKRFGSLSNAYRLAGIPLSKYGNPIKTF